MALWAWMTGSVLKLNSSKLDYGNSLLQKMPEKDITRLQGAQNCLTRVVTKVTHLSCSVPILKRFHWLPVKFRIHFKICTTTYRTIKDTQPAFVADLLVWPKFSKYLHFTNSNRFVVPHIKTKTGSSAFSISGPVYDNKRCPRQICFPEITLISPIWCVLPTLVPQWPSSLDEPAFALIMTHDHAKDLCTAELGPLRISSL